MKLAAVVVIACLSSTLARPPRRIVGARKAETGEFPSQVSIRMFGLHFCGGSILDETHILTAAHCVEDDDRQKLEGLTVSFGNNKLASKWTTSYKIKSVHPHEDYDIVDPYPNDIAIITLGSAIPFNDYQKPIELPEEDVLAGDKVMVSGWGVEKYPAGPYDISLHLLKMETEVVSNAYCSKQHESDIQPGQICTYSKQGQGACSGDSGNGLIYENTIVGIASWVSPCGIGDPDVFTRVYAYRDWIKKTIADNP